MNATLTETAKTRPLCHLFVVATLLTNISNTCYDAKPVRLTQSPFNKEFHMNSSDTPHLIEPRRTSLMEIFELARDISDDEQRILDADVSKITTHDKLNFFDI